MVQSGAITVKSGAKGDLNMLYGRYEHTIDSKNRVFVPAKYKEALGDSFKLSHNGFNKCILVYSNEEWQKYEETLASYPPTEFEDYIREVYSNTVDVQIDAQGRIVIPNYLKEKLKVNEDSVIKNLAILGVGTHLEIWSVEGYDQKSKKVDMENIRNLMIQRKL